MTTPPNPVPARRGSLIGPILVIAIGAAFLISNFRPELSVWRLFARYWPLLLIFWGGARLVEYAVARFTSRPIARTLGGGEVFLIILICLAGTVATARFDRIAWRLPQRSLEVLGESYEFPIQASREIPPNARVVIHNLNGNVRVAGKDTKQIEISGRKSIRALHRSAAEEADKQTALNLAIEGDQVVVRTNQERVSGERRITVELEIDLPRGVALSMEGRYGDWDVRDVAGPVQVSSANAGVRLNNITKDVTVNVRRSDVVRATDIKGNVSITGRGQDVEVEKVAGTVSVDGEFTGSIRMVDLAKPARYNSNRTELTFEKLPGHLEMDQGSLQASNVIGPFKLSTRTKKDVKLDGFAKEVDLSLQRGDIELRTSKLPLANIHAESRQGDIHLELPANASFQFQATATHGEAFSEFSNIKVEQRGKSIVEMRGGAGAAGAQVRVSTERGAIRLKKAGSEGPFPKATI